MKTLITRGSRTYVVAHIAFWEGDGATNRGVHWPEGEPAPVPKHEFSMDIFCIGAETPATEYFDSEEDLLKFENELRQAIQDFYWQNSPVCPG